MTLHCVYSPAALEPASGLAGALASGDAVLLLDAASCLASVGVDLGDAIEVYALADDVAAHGVANPVAGIRCLDFDGWVALTESHPRQQVWT